MRKRNFKPKKEPKLFTALHSIVLTLCKIDFLPIKKKKSQEASTEWNPTQNNRGGWCVCWWVLVGRQNLRTHNEPGPDMSVDSNKPFYRYSLFP
jgi:hypothetical protein